jgi:hypothetical protein
MSTSPIGTRVATISLNSIIRAGIPLSDDFNATDVSVSVDSLLALVPASGGGVATITSGTGINVDNTDRFNPIVNIDTTYFQSGIYTPTVYGNTELSSIANQRWNYNVIGTTVTISGNLSLIIGDFPFNGVSPFILSNNIGNTFTGVVTTDGVEPISITFNKDGYFEFTGYTIPTNISVFIQYQL